MKHNIKITTLLLLMFLVTQLIGLTILSIYSPKIIQTTDEEGRELNITTYNLPFGMDPPQNTDPGVNLISIIIAITIAVTIILILMKFRAELFLRIWFFVVIIIALGISLNAFILSLPYSSLIALAIAIPLAVIKVFKRDILIHNLTELLIYPGIAAIFVPLFNIWTVVLLLILISVYDMYAVWKAGFMQKMARYQIEKVRVFNGFFIPSINKKTRELMNKIKLTKDKSSLKQRGIKIPIAILGGGDIVFPLILAGVVLAHLGILSALIISAGATLALGGLLLFSDPKKVYPAMPFITSGCLIALGIVYLL